MKNIIKCDSAPAALGPYSHACEANGFIFTSGQLGIDPATGKLAEGVEAQAHQALVNIDNVLKTAGATMKDILKTTIFLVDLNDFAAVNRIYGDRGRSLQGLIRALWRRRSTSSSITGPWSAWAWA